MAKVKTVTIPQMRVHKATGQASLGYVSPVVYEEMHEIKQNRAA